MTRHDVAAILDSEGTLEERFHKVAPCSEEDDDESQTKPFKDEEALVLPADDCSHDKDDNGSSDTAFPGLSR